MRNPPVTIATVTTNLNKTRGWWRCWGRRFDKKKHPIYVICCFCDPVLQSLQKLYIVSYIGGHQGCRGFVFVVVDKTRGPKLLQLKVFAGVLLVFTKFFMEMVCLNNSKTMNATTTYHSVRKAATLFFISPELRDILKPVSM